MSSLFRQIPVSAKPSSCLIIHTDALIHIDTYDTPISITLHICNPLNSPAECLTLKCLSQELRYRCWEGKFDFHSYLSSLLSRLKIEQFDSLYRPGVSVYFLYSSFEIFCFSSYFSLFPPHLTCHKTTHLFLLVRLFLPTLWACSAPLCLIVTTSTIWGMQMHMDTGHGGKK